MTREMRFAEAAHFVYMTNILDRDIIAIEMSVKYCINAITSAVEEVPTDTKYALTAITATIPPFIKSVITGFAIPVMMPARVSLFISVALAAS
jgi:copper chaperone CopZ